MMKPMAGLLLVSGCMCMLAGAVRPRNRQRDMEDHRRMAIEKAHMEALAAARLGPKVGVGHPLESLKPSSLPTKTRRFRVSEQRCCKIGEKAARKRMSCNPSIHAVQRRVNKVHKAKLDLYGASQQGKLFKDLSYKIAKCSLSYSRNFEKCCLYRANYYKELALCKRMKGSARRSCKQRVKSKYV